MRIRKALIALGIGSLFAVGAAGCPSAAEPVGEPVGEDCDAEDWANREADCGFVKPKPAGTPVKVPARPPAPRNTRR